MVILQVLLALYPGPLNPGLPTSPDSTVPERIPYHGLVYGASLLSGEPWLRSLTGVHVETEGCHPLDLHQTQPRLLRLGGRGNFAGFMLNENPSWRNPLFTCLVMYLGPRRRLNCFMNQA